MPPLEGKISSLVAWGFWLVELAGSMAGLVLLHVLSRTRQRSAEADAHPVGGHDGGVPLIDVLIPTYNEQEAILTRTLVGALAQDYPRFRVWVLDDGKRPWLEALARRLGAGYRTRQGNAHAKAGNMNAALDDLFALPDPPDLVAVLDADFVATPAFLARAASLMHDPEVAVVQTPQMFFNPDPVQLNLGAAGVIPDEQRFFFDVILASKDAHGTAFSCGTSSLVRREALQQIGGFPTESVTEDMLLSIKLKALGWRTVYLNEPLTTGLAPEGLQEYLTQRGRWCLGAMQIFRSAWGPLARGAMPWRMRLHTIDTVLYWAVSPLTRILALLMPPLYWWFGVVVMRTDLTGIVSHLGPYWIANVGYLAWVSRGSNVPVLADAMALLVARESLRASFVGLFGARNQAFKVTAKGATRDRTVVQWSLAGWFLGLALLTLGGIYFAAWHGAWRGAAVGAEVMNLFWSLYNLLTLLIATLMCIERPRYRAEERFWAREPAQLETGAGALAVELRDLSVSGCHFRLPDEAAPEVGDLLDLTVQGVGALACEVRRVRGRDCHVAFRAEGTGQLGLIRKLFSGAYLRPVQAMQTPDLLRVLLRAGLG